MGRTKTGKQQDHINLPFQNVISDLRIYPPGKYCVDDMLVTHNVTLGGDAQPKTSQDNKELEFAFICVNNKVRLFNLRIYCVNYKGRLFKKTNN